MAFLLALLLLMKQATGKTAVTWEIFGIVYVNSYSFGMQHDGFGNQCGGARQGLMSALPSSRIRLFQWSSCSKQYIRDYLRYNDKYYDIRLNAIMMSNI